MQQAKIQQWRLKEHLKMLTYMCVTSTFVINYDTHKLTKCYVSWPLHFNSYEIIKKRTFSCKIYTAKV